MLARPATANLSAAIDGVTWALRVSERFGGPDAIDHLAELRLHLLRRRHAAWRPGHRAEVELAIDLVAAQLDGRDAVLPLTDAHSCRRLLLHLQLMERALRLTLPSRATSKVVVAA